MENYLENILARNHTVPSSNKYSVAQNRFYGRQYINYLHTAAYDNILKFNPEENEPRPIYPMPWPRPFNHDHVIPGLSLRLGS